MALERVASLLELSEAAVKKRLPGAGFSAMIIACAAPVRSTGGHHHCHARRVE
jgi:hypothetical protein